MICSEAPAAFLAPHFSQQISETLRDRLVAIRED
jgi:hypothetical protein